MKRKTDMASAADYLEDPLYGHTRYRKIKDLNEGTFGIVLLALDIRSNEQVGGPLSPVDNFEAETPLVFHLRQLHLLLGMKGLR